MGSCTLCRGMMPGACACPLSLHAEANFCNRRRCSTSTSSPVEKQPWLPSNVVATHLELDSASALGLDGSGAINGRAEGIHNAAQPLGRRYKGCGRLSLQRTKRFPGRPGRSPELHKSAQGIPAPSCRNCKVTISRILNLRDPCSSPQRLIGWKRREGGP